MSVAIYPGSFDPVTNGHINMIERGAAIFDELIVAVAINTDKAPLFTTEERMSFLREAVGDRPNIRIDSFKGLLVNYAAQKKASAVLRGLRALSDFEYEFQMAHMNRRLSSDIETVFMMTGEEHFYVSSKMVREVVRFEGSVTGLVPSNVEDALKQRFGKNP